VDLLRSALPGVLLSTDLLVGFPGETEEDFRQILTLMEEVRFDEAFTYYYNPREGTAAWNMPDSVAESLKLERLYEVIALQRAIGTEKKESRRGTTVKVLAEEVSKKNNAEILGRTEGDEMVVFPAPASRIGNFCTVRLAGLRGNTFYAYEVEK
jgi:tRNA-2-methylthio-N6-dimethylallyladenosine synthase